MSEAKMAVSFATSSPDPEVSAKAQRRKFSVEDKKRILGEVERAAGHGGIQGRLTSVQYKNGGSLLRSMRRVYADGNRRITTCRDLNTPGDLATVEVTSYDQLGEVNATAQLESSNPNGSNCADTPPAGIRPYKPPIRGTPLRFRQR